MPRSPLYAVLRRAVRDAARGGDRPGALPRRTFLRAAAGLGVAALLPPVLPAAAGAPGVVVVGGGLAGLMAARVLARSGIHARVLEARGEPGGRVRTGRGFPDRSHAVELGGTFIESEQEELLALVAELGLELEDRLGPALAHLEEKTVFFGGRRGNEADFARVLAPAARRLRARVVALGGRGPGDPSPAVRELDRRTVAEVLDELGIPGAVRGLVDAAYESEFGLPPVEQSGWNVIDLVAGAGGDDASRVLGNVDERYRIRGGNQQLAARMARALPRLVEYGVAVEAVRPRGRGFRVAVRRDGGARGTLDADVLVLALPAAVLRELDLAVELPGVTRRAIAELGYGENAKVLLGMRTRPWRAQGAAGYLLSDLGVQVAWDDTMAAPGPPGALTIYTGGRASRRLVRGDLDAQVAGFLADLERVYPGTREAHDGRRLRIHWPSRRFARGSYSCARPGQWTAFQGAFRPAGNLHFAGEHCARVWPSYMAGAIESGRVTASRIVAGIGAG